MLRIFVGYDKVESVAYHTLCQSIIEHSSGPVSIVPLKQSMLPMYARPHDPRQSNEFSFTRFLVPHLCDYKGWAVFMDCDMMFRADPYELLWYRDNDKSVMCVQHDYTPKNKTKFLGAVQYEYPRKNWSSVMLFNNAKCKALTPDCVNTAGPAYLHRMEWAEGVGAIPANWNHLVSEYKENPEAKIVHWTVGGPYFHEYANVEFSDEWREMNKKMMHCDQLMKAVENA